MGLGAEVAPATAHRVPVAIARRHRNPPPPRLRQSGYAADRNSVNAGSIPTSASNLLSICASAAQRSPRFNDAHAARKYCDMLQSVIIDAR